MTDIHTLVFIIAMGWLFYNRTFPSISSFAGLICALPFMLWLNYFYNRRKKYKSEKLLHLKLIYDNIKSIPAGVLKKNTDILSIFLCTYDEKYTDKKILQIYFDGIFYYFHQKKIKRIRSTTHIRKNSLKISKKEINHQIDFFKKGTMNEKFYDFILNSPYSDKLMNGTNKGMWYI